MIYSIVSLGLALFPVALLACLLLAFVAYFAGNVFQMWGTTSAWGWIFEASLRIFSGSLRQRLMRKVKGQFSVGVDRSRKTHPYLAVSVSPSDVTTLTGHGGGLSDVAADAVKGYVRHARAEGWASDSAPQVAIVPDEWLRRGSVVVRPVSGQEFIELSREMAEWDEGIEDDQILSIPGSGSATDVDHSTESSRTEWLPDSDVATVAVRTAEVVTESFDPASALTMPAEAAQIVLTDGHGGRHLISSSSILIGRSRECAVRMESAEVSREHVDVYCQEGTWWLRDRGSRNGTTVDGRDVKGVGPVRLQSGSQIIFGREKTGERLTIDSLVEV